jgi:hypothetical protein
MGSEERRTAYMDTVENAEIALVSCGLPISRAAENSEIHSFGRRDN